MRAMLLILQSEWQQVERKQAQQEKAALGKLERIKLDQGKRAEDLEREAAEAESKVPATEANVCSFQSCAFNCTDNRILQFVTSPRVIENHPQRCSRASVLTIWSVKLLKPKAR